MTFPIRCILTVKLAAELHAERSNHFDFNFPEIFFKLTRSSTRRIPDIFDMSAVDSAPFVVQQANDRTSACVCVWETTRSVWTAKVQADQYWRTIK